MSAGEMDLYELLRNMDPELLPGEYVFTTAEKAPVGVDALCLFREPEGVTAIVARADAERLGLTSSETWRLITLRVHSSLAAVGFLARILPELARKGIPANVVSAYFHDHLFVPAGCAGEALQLLRELTRQADRFPQHEGEPRLGGQV